MDGQGQVKPKKKNTEGGCGYGRVLVREGGFDRLMGRRPLSKCVSGPSGVSDVL